MRLLQILTRGAALSLVAVALPPVLSPNTAQAYCATPFRWAGNYLYTKPGGAVPNGWNDQLKASANQWNGIPNAHWTIDWNVNSASHFMFRYSTPAAGFGGAPAVTVTETSLGGYGVTGGDIFFDPSWTWNENGNMNQAQRRVDIRTVAVHELGHELVLTHPNDCGQMTTAEVNSAMNPNYTKKWTINSDDRAGAAVMKP